MKFKDISQLTKDGEWETHIFLRDVDSYISYWEEDDYYKLQLNPDFQRGHVWTPQQQSEFVEYLLRGGRGQRTIYFNNPDWVSDSKGTYHEFVCVDGLQRLTAVRKFLRNEIPAFGHLYNEFEDRIPSRIDLKLNVNNLQTRREVLQWYLEINAKGTPHSKEELERVQNMLKEEVSL